MALKRRLRQVLLLALIIALGSACTPQNEVTSAPSLAPAEAAEVATASVPESLALRSQTSTTAPIATSTSTTTVVEPTWDRSALQRVVDDTIAVDRMSFELEFLMVLDGRELPFRRSGWFDDGTFQAEGAQEQATGLAFEYRITADEFWTFDSASGEWVGAKRNEVLGTIDENAVQSMDGDRSLFKITEAVTLIENGEVLPDGSTIVRTHLAADDLLYTISESGFADRLAQVGGTSTGATAEATFRIENGLVAAIEADFSEWWSEVSRQLLQDGGLEVPGAPSAAELRVNYTPYAESRTSERPCAEPTTTEAEAPVIYRC